MIFSTHAALSMIREISKGEAIFRPSAATRWTKCAGSVWACLQVPRQKSSPAAMEGTAAHHIGAEALQGIRQPEEWVGRHVDVEGTKIYVDEDMQEHVEGYVDFVRAEAEGADAVYIERGLTLAALDPNDPLLQENRGTGDVVILFLKRRLIKIIDLKFGRGVMVSAQSLQLADYGLLAMLNFPIQGGWDQIECIIYQPRAPRDDEKLKRHIYTENELSTEFLGKLLQAMTEAVQPDAPLVAGPHCKDTFCAAAATCPALRDAAINIAQDAFNSAPLEPITNMTALVPIPSQEETRVKLPDPRTLDIADIATILDRRVMYDAWLAGVEQYAVQLMTSGNVTIPGWQLSMSNTHRKWIDEEEKLIPQLEALGLKKENLYNLPKLKSPAQVEKLLPKAQKPAIGALAEKPPGNVVLTRADESRATVAPVFTSLPTEQ